MTPNHVLLTQITHEQRMTAVSQSHTTKLPQLKMFSHFGIH